MDEISNFKDKHLKEYGEKKTNKQTTTTTKTPQSYPITSKEI